MRDQHVCGLPLLPSQRRIRELENSSGLSRFQISITTVPTVSYTNHVDSPKRDVLIQHKRKKSLVHRIHSQLELCTYKVNDDPSVREPARRFTEESVSIWRRDPVERRRPTSSVGVRIAKVINRRELTGPGATFFNSGEEE